MQQWEFRHILVDSRLVLLEVNGVKPDKTVARLRASNIYVYIGQIEAEGWQFASTYSTTPDGRGITSKTMFIFTRHKQQDFTPPLWEYKHVVTNEYNGVTRVNSEKFDRLSQQQHEILSIYTYSADLGEDGWQLVTVYNIEAHEYMVPRVPTHVYLFKRPRQHFEEMPYSPFPQ